MTTLPLSMCVPIAADDGIKKEERGPHRGIPYLPALTSALANGVFSSFSHSSGSPLPQKSHAYRTYCFPGPSLINFLLNSGYIAASLRPRAAYIFCIKQFPTYKVEKSSIPVVCSSPAT